MLSPTSTDVIRTTLPVVGAAIADITPLFYRKMFDAHPELERDLFNRGNQKQGEQQKALAGAIAAFAALQLEPDQARVDLDPVADREQARLTGDRARRSTRSCTTTCSRPSSRSSVTPSLPRSLQPGTRCTG